MRLDFALLADGAVAHDGKLYLHGAGLRRIDVPQLPWLVRASVVVRWTAELTEAGDHHELQIRVAAPDGASAVLPPLPLNLQPVGSVPGDWDEISALLVAELSLGFIAEGWYQLELSLDGEPFERLRLRIVVNPESVEEARPVEEA